MLIWIDLETTGLDPKEDIILEIAIVATDDDLVELAHYTSLVVTENPLRFIPRVSALTQASSNRLVYEAHFDNGLVADLYKAQTRNVPVPDLQYVQNQAVSFLNSMGVHRELAMKDRPLLAGASISFDRSFLTVYMPEVLGLLHYRNVDVTTIRELAKRWWPELPKLESKSEHRALGDIRESIDLLKYYREKEFVCGA